MFAVRIPRNLRKGKAKNSFFCKRELRLDFGRKIRYNNTVLHTPVCRNGRRGGLKIPCVISKAVFKKLRIHAGFRVIAELQKRSIPPEHPSNFQNPLLFEHHGCLRSIHQCPRKLNICRCVGMADDVDSKSIGSDTVWVRPPPSALKSSLESQDFRLLFFFIPHIRLIFTLLSPLGRS